MYPQKTKLSLKKRKETPLYKEKTKLKKQCKVRGLTASSSGKSHCQEMKSSTSADNVVLTDQQEREEMLVIFDNVILQSRIVTIFAKNGAVRSYKTSSVQISLNLRIMGCILKISFPSKHADSGHLFTKTMMECFAYYAANTTRKTYVTILILGMQLHR